MAFLSSLWYIATMLPPPVESLLSQVLLSMLYRFVYDRWLTHGKRMDELCGLILHADIDWVKAFLGQSLEKGSYHLGAIEKNKLEIMLELLPNAALVKQELGAPSEPSDLRIMILTEKNLFFVDVSFDSFSPILTIKGECAASSAKIRYAGEA